MGLDYLGDEVGWDCSLLQEEKFLGHQLGPHVLPGGLSNLAHLVLQLPGHLKLIFAALLLEPCARRQGHVTVSRRGGRFSACSSNTSAKVGVLKVSYLCPLGGSGTLLPCCTFFIGPINSNSNSNSLCYS